MKSSLGLLLVCLLTACGSEEDVFVIDDQGNVVTQGDFNVRLALEDRLITGRNIITSNPWNCEFLDDQGMAMFLDEYEFLIDRSGTAKDGFFDWDAISATAISVTDNVGGLPGAGVYTISGILFESVGFSNDRFTATLEGTYFEDAILRNFPLRCARSAPAIF